MIKKYFSLLLLSGLLFTAVAHAQVASELKPPADVLVLKEISWDFGKIQQGRPVTHLFEVVNSGKETIHLDNVQASCGCTTPEWSHEPIAPGGKSTIKVGYNAAAEGSFAKTITIQYNGGLSKTMTISGIVFKAPATSAPANSSIALLKQSNQ